MSQICTSPRLSSDTLLYHGQQDMAATDLTAEIFTECQNKPIKKLILQSLNISTIHSDFLKKMNELLSVEIIDSPVECIEDCAFSRDPNYPTTMLTIKFKSVYFEKQFNSRALVNINRPTEIYLNSPDIFVANEKAFVNFLNDNPNNKIYFRYWDAICDCKFAWVYQLREFLKNKLVNQIFCFRAVNQDKSEYPLSFKFLWTLDPKLFQNC